MPMSPPTALDQLCIDTVRTLAIDAIDRANSGHPGLPLGAAPMAWTLWARHLAFDPAAPDWPDRDRFVLSAGHGSMLQYALLHLFGYELPLDELRDFRQWGSKTPGHPEYAHTPGVEATTGPLGQGTANSVGMAMAERFLAGRYNTKEHTLVDHRTWALVGDGDLMEGVAYEAASLAGHLGLSKLTWLYDANDVSLDGPLDMSFAEDVKARFEAQGWGVEVVGDGDKDLAAIDAALQAARDDTERPTLILVKTTIGYGSPNRAGLCAAHGSPLGAEESALTKQALGWEASEPFHVPEEVRALCAERAPLVDVLLQQRAASGIGNVYKSELLFLEQHAPLTELRSVNDDALRALYERAHVLLRQNLGPGLRRTHPGGLWVYRRGGEGCLKCGTRIQRARLGRHARSTYWCASCQAGSAS